MNSTRAIVGRVRRGLGVLLLALWVIPTMASPAFAEESCALFTQDSFPYGQVWWRVKPSPEAETPTLGNTPEGRAAYLVIAVRPDGILIQNREARYPRLLSWKVVGRNLISVDGRRTWRPGCAP